MNPHYFQYLEFTFLYFVWFIHVKNTIPCCSMCSFWCGLVLKRVFINIRYYYKNKTKTPRRVLNLLYFVMKLYKKVRIFFIVHSVYLIFIKYNFLERLYFSFFFLQFGPLKAAMRNRRPSTSFHPTHERFRSESRPMRWKLPRTREI